MHRLANPSHPGRFLKSEVIEPYGLSVTEAAKVLGVTRPALSSLLNGRSALSAEMALRVEKAFGLEMDTMMRMQTMFDVALLRKREGDIKVQRYEPKAA
jgi:addiction module HigA family antidote